MSITVPMTATVIADSALAPKRPIAAATEADLAELSHYLRAYGRTPVVSTVFAGDQSAGAGVQPYIEGAASASQPHAVWCVPVAGALWTHWEITALVENTSGSHSGKVRVTRASDGTYTEITVNAGSAQWTTITGALAIDSAQSTEQLRMAAVNGASGVVRVHAIEIRHQPLASISAAKVTAPGTSLTWRPVDTAEVAADAPLSTALRARLHQSLEVLRRSWVDAIVGWSDATLYRVAAYQQTTTPYVEVVRVPFVAPALRRRVRWALYGFVSSGTGYVRISTGYSRAAGVADVEKQLAVGWSSPFSAGLIKYSDSGAGAVECAELQADELLVEIKGTGATLMGLVAWLVDE